MSPPSILIRPFRLSGRVAALLLVALLGLPAGSAAGATSPHETNEGSPADFGDGRHLGASGALSLTAVSGFRSAAVPRGGWLWPLPPPHHVIQPFVPPPTRFAAGHRGIDIAAPVGATVTSPDGGIVHFVGVVVDRPVLSIQHADGVISSFEPIISPLIAGQPVARGAPLGIVRAGHRLEPSLHLGVRVHGEYVSPLVFLGGIHPAVLLPTRRI